MKLNLSESDLLNLAGLSGVAKVAAAIAIDARSITVEETEDGGVKVKLGEGGEITVGSLGEGGSIAAVLAKSGLR